MSSSDDEVDETPFVQYSARPEWSDVVPVEQEDGGKGEVVAIMYSENYRVTMNYFRAVLRSGEVSERVLQLTSDCILMNAANYTVWHYRRKCLKEMKDLDVKEELDFVERLATIHPKNYQLWFHRQAIVEHFKEPGDEDRFTRKALMQEPKNYHAWGYRQFYLKQFDLFEGELAYVDELLKLDVRNNSAWAHRHYVIANTTTWDGEGVRAREIKYALAVIRRTPNNESAWNYLNGCVLGSEYKLFPEIEASCTELHEKHIPSPFIAETLVRIYEQQIRSGDPTNLTKAHELLEDLVKFDSIREKYWHYRKQKLPSPEIVK